MVYTYTPTYYTSLQDSITSICKNILPFSFKKKKLPAIAAAEQRLSKQQSDNLKWQQDSFHKMFNLMGLCKEGIISENEVSVFRDHLLESLITSSVDYEPPLILRDKLIFLQELFYAKCITEDEYHASKRPLLQRLAVQGAEIEARDVIVGAKKEVSSSNVEEWSVIELRDEEKSGSANKEHSLLKKRPKELLTKAIKTRALKEKDELCHKKFNTGLVVMSSTENPFWNRDLDEKESESRKSILAMESFPETVEEQSGAVREKPKGKAFVKALFGQDHNNAAEKEKAKPVKKGWGFHRLAKWNKIDHEQEKSLLSRVEKSRDEASYVKQIVEDPVVEKEYMKEAEKSTHEEKLSENWATFDEDDDSENANPNLFAAAAAAASENLNKHSTYHQGRFSLTNKSITTSSSIDKGFKYNPFFDM